MTEPALEAAAAARITAAIASVASVAGIAGIAGVASVAAGIAAVAMERPAETAPPAFAARVVAAAVAAVVTTATTRRCRRCSGCTRLGAVGAREPGRCYQQESSIHDYTSLGDFSAEGRGRCGRDFSTVEKPPTSALLSPKPLKRSIPGARLSALPFAGLCQLLSAPERHFFNRFTRSPQPADFSIFSDLFSIVARITHFARSCGAENSQGPECAA